MLSPRLRDDIVRCNGSDRPFYQFLRGESPQAIVQAYPSLSLLRVYGGITYYLAHQVEIDEYLRRGEPRFAELAQAAHEANPLLYAKLEAAKHATPRG